MKKFLVATLSLLILSSIISLQVSARGLIQSEDESQSGPLPTFENRNQCARYYGQESATCRLECRKTYARQKILLRTKELELIAAASTQGQCLKRCNLAYFTSIDTECRKLPASKVSSRATE